ncbi:MAG: cupin domain-containing protein [Rhodospirillaceae bacterium]
MPTPAAASPPSTSTGSSSRSSRPRNRARAPASDCPWSSGPVAFPAHDHPGGEEILVLDGVLEDEFGRYPAGAWLPNPPGSRHAASSPGPGRLFVKTGHLLSPPNL